MTAGAVSAIDQWRNIGLLVFAEVLAMSLWFSASAVVPRLAVEWADHCHASPHALRTSDCGVRDLLSGCRIFFRASRCAYGHLFANPFETRCLCSEIVSLESGLTAPTPRAS